MCEGGPDGGFFLSGGPEGCLLLHGLSGPGQVRPLAEELQQSGFSVSVPEIPYARETLRGPAPSNWRVWLDMAREAYARLDRTHASVAVAGIGVGGAIALFLAAEYPVSRVAVISPFLRLRDPARFLFSPGRRRELTGEAFRLRDLLAVERLTRRRLFAVVAPVLVVQPQRGKFIHPAVARLILSGVSSREAAVVWLTQSRHDYPSGEDRARAMTAIKNHLRPSTASNALEN